MKQLCVWIVPSLVDFFRNEYNKIAATHGKKAMSTFQTFCTEVPKWNQDVIDSRINGVLDGCRCDYVEELVTAVFIAHTKMLTAIRTSNKQKKLQITLPKLDHFLHRVFTECARTLWKAPYLFSTELSAVERQKNILQAESMCTEAMNAAVRSLLPVKNILREYLEEEEAESEKKEELDLVEDAEAESVADTAEAVNAEKKEKIDKTDEAKAAEAKADEAEKTAEPKQPKPKKQSLLLTKMDSPPGPATPVGSDHVVELPATTGSVTLEKSEDTTSPSQEAPQTIQKVPLVIQEALPLSPLATKPGPAKEALPLSPLATKPGEEALLATKPAKEGPQHLTIETEPAVHFTPYDTVFEDKTGESTIEYAPKISVEDKPPSTWGLEEEGPSLVISDTSSAIGIEDIEDLDAPPVVGVTEAVAEDIDAPLSTTSDFEELS